MQSSERDCGWELAVKQLSFWLLENNGEGSLELGSSLETMARIGGAPLLKNIVLNLVPRLTHDTP